MQLFNIVITITAVVGFSATPGMGASVEAKKDGVKVLDAPSASGAEIATLKKGESAESEDRQGMYWTVKIGGKAGFVSVMQVNRKQGEPSSLSNAIKSAVKQGRAEDDPGNSRGRSAVMGVRGLDDSDDTAFAGNVKPNVRLVFQMEDFQTGPKRIEALGELVFAEIETKAK